jgi:hypothetical protein
MIVIINVIYINICLYISIRVQQLSVSLQIYQPTLQDLLPSSAWVNSTKVQFSEGGKVWFPKSSPSCTAKKGQCESKINVWFPFMYSQKWSCAASLFPKQNYNVLSPSSFTHISVRDLYIPMIGLPILLQPNMWILGIYKSLNTHECGNLDWGCAITRKEYINGSFVAL